MKKILTLITLAGAFAIAAPALAQDIGEDRGAIRTDESQIHQDRAIERQDERSGNYAGARQEQHQINQEHRDIGHERKDIRHDRREHREHREHRAHDHRAHDEHHE